MACRSIRSRRARSACTRRLPSLELGLDRSAKAGNCDSGYSCVYTSNLSWRSEVSSVAKETDPAAVFDRLFGDALADASQQQRAKQQRYRKSVLDLVREDAQDLQQRLGGADRQKLEEYLYAVRDIERRMEQANREQNVAGARRLSTAIGHTPGV